MSARGKGGWTREVSEGNGFEARSRLGPNPKNPEVTGPRRRARRDAARRLGRFRRRRGLARYRARWFEGELGGILTAGVVVNASLGEHRVVLDLRLAQGRAVVGDDDQLGLAGAKGLEDGLVPESVLAGPAERAGWEAETTSEARFGGRRMGEARRPAGGAVAEKRWLRHAPHDNLKTVVDAIVLLALLLGLGNLDGGHGGRV